MINPVVEDDCRALAEAVALDDYRGKTVLVSGANGFLGSYIVQLLSHGNRTRDLGCTVLCSSLSGASPRLARLMAADQNLVDLRADFSQPFSFDERIDFIFHAAGYAQPALWMDEKLKTIDINVTGVRSLLELARRDDARFLFFSTLDVYGDPEITPTPETYNGSLSTLAERAAYGESKRLGEVICNIYRQEYGVTAYAARISHVYGPGISLQDRRVLGDFLRGAMTRGRIEMRDQGQAIKTFGYIADVIFMIMRIMQGGQEMIYNVGGVDRLTIRQLAELVADVVGKTEISALEKDTAAGHIGTDPDEVGLDLSKFETEFGAVDFLAMKTGIERTIAWIEAEPADDKGADGAS